MTKTVDAKHIQFDVDVILGELGGFGKYQAINFALICMSVIISAVTSLTYVFATGNLNYRCKISTCDTEPAALYEPNWLVHAVPYSHDLPEKCIRYINTVDNATQCYDVNMFNATEQIRCDEFVYETNEVTLLNEVIQSDLKNEWKLAFVGTVNGIALLVAIPIFGILSDRYGRRTLFVFGLFCSSIFGLLKSFSSSYIMYIVCEFSETAIGAGAYATSFILAMELLEPNKRVIGGTLIGMNVSNFRTLLQISYTPLLLVITYLWLLPESVRWLAINGRRKEAAKTILRAAKINSIQLSDHVLDMIKATDCNLEEKSTTNDESKDRTGQTFFDVFRSKVLLARLSIGSICWITNALVYYGLSLNSVNLAGSKYINFMLVCAAEIPGYFITIIVMERIGRKWSLCGSMVICGFPASLPLLLFGITSIASGLLVLRLPETLNTNLPDTIEEAEQLGKKSRNTL